MCESLNVCVCVCVYVREGERERECVYRVSHSVCPCVLYVLEAEKYTLKILKGLKEALTLKQACPVTLNLGQHVSVSICLVVVCFSVSVW